MNYSSFNVQIKNVEKVNSLFSRCKVYICYSELNRNNSIIPRNVIEANLHTLYNCPIVGEFDKKKEDFLDHGGKVELNADGDLDYITTTMPYGLVHESSEVKWESVDDKDYLTCTGYLWTDRYPEIIDSIEESRGQSMEISNLSGEFDSNGKFVVSSFNFSGLCILGKTVEPCFEDAKIELYALNKDDFKVQFNLMMEELKELINYENKNIKNSENLINETQDYTINNIKEDEVVVKTKKEIATQFSLTVNQLWDELSRSIKEMTYKVNDWWSGEEVDRNRYYMNDFDDTYVFAVDKMSDYVDVKIPYSMNGDNVVIDFENAKRIKYVATDWEEGSSEEEIQEGVSNFAKNLVNEVEEQISEKVAEFTKAISDKEDAVLAFGQKISELETKFAAQEVLINEKEVKINELNEQVTNFKKVEDNEQVESLLKEFTHLITDDEKVELREKRELFTKFDDFKKEVKSFVCDRVIAKSKETNPNFISMALVDNQTQDENKKPETLWDRLEKNKI